MEAWERDVRSSEECRQARLRIAGLLRECGPLLSALGDETRQDIVCALLDAGPRGMRVGEITQVTHLSRPAVSHHLKVLKTVGAISMRKQGTMNFYHIDGAPAVWASLWRLTDDARSIVLSGPPPADNARTNSNNITS